MYGVAWSLPSRTIALCCAYSWLSVPAEPWRPARAWPRSNSAFVIAWNIFPPWPVKPSVTCGAPVFWSAPALMFDSLRSFPTISGGPFGLSG